MSSAILAQIGLPILAQIVGEALSRVDHPAAQKAGALLGELNGAVERGEVTPDMLAHAEKMAQIRADEITATTTQVNESLRAEIASDDVYVRRMRPTFGYFVAISWAAQMLALAWIIVFRTHEAKIVVEAMESMSFIWAAGLSVMGIYVYKRSDDKKQDKGQSWMPRKPILPVTRHKLND